MAKGKVNYQIPQKGSVAKITAIIVAVILVISGVLTAINYGSHGFTDWNVRSWFNSWGQGQGITDDDVTEYENESTTEQEIESWHFAVTQSSTLDSGVLPAAEQGKIEIFSGENSIANTKKGKAGEWLQGKTYDSFCYTVTFHTAGYDKYAYSFSHKSYENINVGVGNVDYQPTPFDSSTYQTVIGVIDANNMSNIHYSAAIVFGTPSSSYQFIKLEITEKQLRACRKSVDDDTWTNNTQTYDSTSKVYTEIKKMFMTDGLTFEDSISDLPVTGARIKESLHLYKTGEEQEPIPLPDDPVKEGYTFIGWFYGTNDACDGNCTQYDGTPIFEPTDFHAHFEINRYTVTYDVAGAEEEIESQEVDWNTVLTPPTPTKTGYDFKGWYLSDGTKYEDQPIKENTTLTAKWEIKIFTVTFYVDGKVYATKEVKYGTPFSSVIKDAEDAEKLRSLTVFSAYGEWTVESIADAPITDNYSINATPVPISEIAQSFLQDYPWIFSAVGAALSVLVVIFSVMGYFWKKNKVINQRKTRRRRK